MPEYNLNAVTSPSVDIFGKMQNPIITLENPETGITTTATMDKNWGIGARSTSGMTGTTIGQFLMITKRTYENLSNSIATHINYEKALDIRDFNNTAKVTIEPELKIVYDWTTTTGRVAYTFTTEESLLFVNLASMNSSSGYYKLDSNWEKPPTIHFVRESSNRKFTIYLNNNRTTTSPKNQHIGILLGLFESNYIGRLKIPIVKAVT